MIGVTVAGGHGQGQALNQLYQPCGLDSDNDGTLFIADCGNDRVMRWKRDETEGELVVGGKGKGNRIDQLNHPFTLLIDRTNDCLITSELGNRRVMRWSLDKIQRNVAQGEVIISNIHSLGLALDNEGSLYVSDLEKHEVRRCGPQDGDKGVIVAGGNGRGAALNQLGFSCHTFVDDDHSVYVSDLDNHRVIKWMKSAQEEIIVAGGQREGNRLGQLNYPSGIFVDRMGSVYVADQGNHRVTRWLKNPKQGEVIVGGNGQGSETKQFNGPASISFDHQENLYVADYYNHRIQRFNVE